VATQDPSTQAVISALGSGQSFGASVDRETGSIPTPAVQAALAAIRAQDEQSRTELVNTVEFSYSSDIMQLGDPFSVVIPNPRGKYTNQFTRGQKVELSLKNPNVNGGQPTLKQRGVIVRRHSSTSSSGGSVIRRKGERLVNIYDGHELLVPLTSVALILLDRLRGWSGWACSLALLDAVG